MPLWWNDFWRKFQGQVQDWLNKARNLSGRSNSQQALPRFIARFAKEGLPPITPKERNYFPSYQKCQACSLCTFSCAAIIKGMAPPSFEPKFILLGVGRSAHEAELMLEEWAPCLECHECTVICPNSVPVHAMAAQIRERQHHFRELTQEISREEIEKLTGAT